MILNGIEEIRKLLPSINLRDDSDRIDDFISKAQSWVTDTVIGTELETALESAVNDGADSHANLRLRVKRVIAEKAYLMFGDEMNLQLGEAGMVVQNNKDMTPASSSRRDNLMRSLEQRLDDDCDALVSFLMKNCFPSTGEHPATYGEWTKTEQFAYLTATFMPTLKELRLHLPFKSGYTGHWADFNESLLNMSVSMMDTASVYVSSAEIVRLRVLYRENGLNDMQRIATFRLADVAAACLVNDQTKAYKSAIGARQTMLRHLDDFPSFAASDCKTLPGVDFNAGHLVNTR